jgi:hypothetical protein
MRSVEKAVFKKVIFKDKREIPSKKNIKPEIRMDTNRIEPYNLFLQLLTFFIWCMLKFNSKTFT